MIRVLFCEQNGSLTGFRLSGHSGYAAAGSDIVCAAATSAALMTANTVTEILHIPAKAEATDGLIRLKLKPRDAAAAQPVLRGLLLHLRQLAETYPQNFSLQLQKSTINLSEVQ